MKIVSNAHNYSYTTERIPTTHNSRRPCYTGSSMGVRWRSLFRVQGRRYTCRYSKFLYNFSSSTLFQGHLAHAVMNIDENLSVTENLFLHDSLEDWVHGWVVKVLLGYQSNWKRWNSDLEKPFLILNSSCAEWWLERTLLELRVLGLGRKKGFGSQCTSGGSTNTYHIKCHGYD